MKMIGQYRIALLPEADPAAFVAHMNDVVFASPSALQLTRITRSFGHALLAAPMRQYVWQVTVDLVTDAGYDFAGNAGRVQEAVAGHGVLVAIDAFHDATAS